MFLEKCKEELERILVEHGGERQAILPCLHAVQKTFGFIPEEVITFLAEKLNLPSVDVYSVATFYSMFSLTAQGKHVIRVCTSLSCHIKGHREILETLRKELGVEEGTTPDGKFTLEVVSCLGLCDKAPAMMVNEEVYGNLTPIKVREIISKYRRGSK